MSTGARYAAWAGMFVFGVAIALLGTALPLLAARAHFDLAQAGLLFFTLNAGVVACALLLGPWVDRHGTKPALIAGPLLVAFALLLTSVAGEFPPMLVAALALGVGGGVLNIATNTVTSCLYPDPKRKNSELNRLGIFFGLGALLAPVGLGALLHSRGVQPVIWMAAAVCASATVIAAPLRFPPPRCAAAPATLSSLGLLRDPWVVAAALLLFLQSGNEMILSGYATTHLARFADVASAAWAMSAMWVAVIVMRLALAEAARYVGGQLIVIASAALTLPSTLWLLYAPAFGSAAVALTITGAAMAGVFPTVMGLAGARYAARPGAVFGAILAAARTGAMLIPWLAGVLAAERGTGAAIALASFSAGGILLLALALTLGGAIVTGPRSELGG